MDILVQIIRNFDIVAIQEIRDAAGTAIITLKNQVNADGSSYKLYDFRIISFPFN